MRRRIWFAALTLCMCVFSASAQQTPTPFPTPTPAEYESAISEAMSGHRVVYVAAAEDEEHLRQISLGAAYLTETFGIVHVEILDGVVAEDEIEPVDAVIVTPAALEDASEDGALWLQDAYRRGVVIAFVNVPFDAQMDALAVKCGRMGLIIALVDYPVDWAAVYHFVASGPEEDVERVVSGFQNCKRKRELDPDRRVTVVSAGSGNSALDGPYGGLLALGMVGAMLPDTYQGE